MFKVKKTNIFLIIILYMMIYNPPILTFNLIHIIAIPSWIYLWNNRKDIQVYFDLKKIYSVMILIAMILGYGIIISLSNFNSPYTFAHQFYWIYGDIPFAISVWLFIKKNNGDFETLMHHLICTSFIMSLTAILALISPTIKNFFTQRMLNYGVLYADQLSVYRNYGFAANLTSFSSMFQSIIAIICFHYVIKGDKRYFIPFPFIVISAIINTRSSLLFLAVGLILVVANSVFKVKMRYLIRMILMLVLFCGLLNVGTNIIAKYNPQTLEWIRTGIGQIEGFISGEDKQSGYFGELDDMTSSSNPTGYDLIFGVGTSIMGGSKYNKRSDVGFINDLWRGGLIYSAFMIVSFMLMIRHILQSTILENFDKRFFAIYFFFIAILTNIKGSFFIHSDVTVLLWIFYTATVFNRDNKMNYKYIIKIK